MRWLDRLERRLRPYAIGNVTLGLILGQVVLYVLTISQPQALVNVVLIPDLVMQGEVWRLVSFLFVPPISNPIFAFIFWSLFYFMGTALEHQWGTLRYNVFLLIGTVATIAAAFITPHMAASNGYLQGSVFLAFAYLYPEFEVLLMFLLPIKVKWLALLAWITYFYTMIFSDSWSPRLMATAAVVNFFIFFGRDIFQRMRHGHRRMAAHAKRIVDAKKPRHVCTVCGVTNLSDPKMKFRYCSMCEGQCGYCMEHIHDHEHVVQKPVA